jgi:hypothetical protein
MHDDYDRSSKWLIQHHGDAILRLAGVEDIESWRALQAEVVQPKQLPDGLLEVVLRGQEHPSLYIAEVATYPADRTQEQSLRDAMLVYLARRELPEVLTLVLCRKGNAATPSTAVRDSRRGWTRLQASWRVVELWDLQAEQLLAAGDIGLVPWVPLTSFAGPPEPILEACRQEIDRLADSDEHENLLAVTQVLARLRYNDPSLLAILGGKQVVIESPLIQEVFVWRVREAILRLLATRFGPVPQDVVQSLERFQDEAQLFDLHALAATCPDLDAFRARLTART